MTQPDRLGIKADTPPRHSVLLVDDEQSVLTLFSAYVRTLGHATTTALSADEAMELLRASGSEIDFALVDIRMPGQHDGAWLIERLGTEFPWIRIVIVTGLSELDPALTLRPNVVAYLVKPLGIHDLQEV